LEQQRLGKDVRKRRANDASGKDQMLHAKRKISSQKRERGRVPDAEGQKLKKKRRKGQTPSPMKKGEEGLLERQLEGARCSQQRTAGDYSKGDSSRRAYGNKHRDTPIETSPSKTEKKESSREGVSFKKGEIGGKKEIRRLGKLPLAKGRQVSWGHAEGVRRKKETSASLPMTVQRSAAIH